MMMVVVLVVVVVVVMTAGSEAINTSDRFQAVVTLLGEQFSVAVGAVRLVVVRRKLLAGECLGAVRAREAVTMPRRVLVRNAALRYHLRTHAQLNSGHVYSLASVGVRSRYLVPTPRTAFLGN